MPRAVATSPTWVLREDPAANALWIGTDDGNVQLTRDGGKTWSAVVPAASSQGAEALTRRLVTRSQLTRHGVVSACSHAADRASSPDFSNAARVCS